MSSNTFQECDGTIQQSSFIEEKHWLQITSTAELISGQIFQAFGFHIIHQQYKRQFDENNFKISETVCEATIDQSRSMAIMITCIRSALKSQESGRFSPLLGPESAKVLGVTNCVEVVIPSRCSNEAINTDLSTYNRSFYSGSDLPSVNSE